MTIAVGFSGNEGIVLAADSQETISGYIEDMRGKFIQSYLRIIVLFASREQSTSDYIETATQKAIEGLGDCDNYNDFVKVLERNLLNFFDI